MEELEGMRRLEDHYRIRRELGRGGMGRVYLAEHQGSGRKMVIKLFSIEDSQGWNKSRFLREAQAVARIDHPNIASIVDVGEAESGYYVATRFIEGETLRKLIETRRLELKEAIRIARQVANGLGAAHRIGIIHRDIKPENIFVNQDGLVTLVDFGIAGERNLTAPGLVLGSVGYMSPEQVLGQNISPRSDLWSLGVVLYEMVSQHRPFEEGSPQDTVTSILKENIPKRTLPPGLERIVTKALEKRVEERYQTAEDMAQDLEQFEKDILDSGTRFTESRRKRAAPSFFRFFRRLKKNAVQRGGELSIQEEESPTTLYINLWIEDESNTTVKLPALLKSEATYTFLFAIERWSREEHGITESFVEPANLKEQPKSPVVIELLCPFLVTKDESGYIRREVEYVAGFGFAPVSFPLKPNRLGSFFLTARLIVKGETIYREVLPLEVVSDENSESLNVDKFAIAAEEN